MAFFQRPERTESEAEAEGQRVWGRPYFPHALLCPTTREQTRKGRGGTVAPSPGKMHKATPTHTQMRPHPHWGLGHHREAEHCGSKEQGRKQRGPTVDRQLAPSCPIPALAPKSTEYPSSLLGHSPLASSFFLLLGTKRKGTEQETEVHPSAPVPHARWSVPCPKW